MLIALANMLISSSNFLFPVETVSLNTSVLEESIERDMRRLNATLTMDDFLDGIAPGPVRESISQLLREETEAQGLPPLQLDSSSWADKFRHCEALETTNRTDPSCEEFFVSYRSRVLVRTAGLRNSLLIEMRLLKWT